MVHPPPTTADTVAAGYRAAADAPATLRATLADLSCYRAWCAAEGRVALPASADGRRLFGVVGSALRRYPFDLVEGG